MTRRGVPSIRGETVRESLARALREGEATARDLSKRVGIPEREVAPHLEHLARSLKARGEHLRVTVPVCLDCDFAFPGRTRLTRPAKCPACKGRRLSLPSFRIEG